MLYTIEIHRNCALILMSIIEYVYHWKNLAEMFFKNHCLFENRPLIKFHRFQEYNLMHCWMISFYQLHLINKTCLYQEQNLNDQIGQSFINSDFLI